MASVVPVCSNCGAGEFVWVNNLKTGSIGRGSLSLRAGGELSLGTRICRSCGHADLFLKDPTILRQPHTWRPGEFVPIPPRPGAPPAKPATGPAPAPTPSGPPLAPSTPPPVAPPSPPRPADPSAPSMPPPAPNPPAPPAPGASGPAPAAEGGLTSDAEPGSEAKKPPRRRAARPKATPPPPTQS